MVHIKQKEAHREEVVTAFRLGATAALIALAANGSSAQDWKQEWERIVAAANQEGAVTMFSQPNQSMRDYIHQEWAKAYPKVELSLSAIPEAQFQARIRIERQSGKYLWDLAVAGSNSGYILAHEGIVDPLLPEIVDPETRNPERWGGWDEAFVDVQRKHVLAATSFIGSPWYNALHIPPETIAQLGLKVMLEPRYAGKTTWMDPDGPGAGRAYGPLLRTKLGDDGLKRLVVDQKTVFVKEQQQVVEAMARGTAWIGVGPPVRSLIQPYLQAGIKADARPFGTGPDVNIMSIGGQTVYVFNKRPHPNATKVFINWILSRDIAQGLAKATGQRSRRLDVPTTTLPDETPERGAKYVMSQREENLDYLNSTGRFVTEIRKGAAQ
jgi:ABC-type glycerol-3-phosphate transport system substrate-binding protein